MAKYDVECPECGTTHTVQLYGSGKDRQWKLDNFDWTCDDCKAKARHEQNEAAAKVNQEAGLPTLIGSEKMIAWAETIRESKFDTIRKVLSGDMDYLSISAFWGDLKIDHPLVPGAIEALKSKTSASWWIDNRELKAGYILQQIIKEAPFAMPADDTARGAEVEAKAEAMVRPETPITETVAEIRITDKAIEVIFPEKREDFRQVVRFGLGYSWNKDKSCWLKVLGLKTGSAQDRAVEIGNKLLAAGFSVRIFDADVRSRAIAGQYEPECHRWIMKRTANQYAGWFSISWPREEDFYKAAKKLPGSRYDKPDVVAPPEQFEQVLDFAEMYGFKLSPGAQELAETARKTRDAALTAKVETRNEDLPPEPGKKPRKLAVPENVGVDNEFKEVK
jgi:hypothetical protein